MHSTVSMGLARCSPALNTPLHVYRTPWNEYPEWLDGTTSPSRCRHTLGRVDERPASRKWATLSSGELWRAVRPAPIFYTSFLDDDGANVRSPARR